MIPHLAPPVLAQVVHRWAVESQQRARRNAMLATTECLRRRVEREDVEDFLSARYPSRYPARRPAAPATETGSGSGSGTETGTDTGTDRPDTLRRSQG